MEKLFSIIEGRKLVRQMHNQEKGRGKQCRNKYATCQVVLRAMKKTNQGEELKSDKKKALVREGGPGCFSLFEQQAAMRGRVL